MVVAVTLTPVLCSYLLTGDRVLQRSQKEPIVSRFLKRIYKKALEWVLSHKRLVIGSTVALFVASLVVFFSLGRNFLPPFNEGSLTINTSTMPGISLEESDKIGREVERILLEIPEIQTVARKTGRAELDEHALGVNVSEMEAPFELDERSRQEFLSDVRARLGVLKGVNIEIGQPISHRIDAMLSGTKANIAIKLFGPDLNRLFSLGNQVKGAVSAGRLFSPGRTSTSCLHDTGISLEESSIRSGASVALSRSSKSAEPRIRARRECLRKPKKRFRRSLTRGLRWRMRRRPRLGQPE